MSPALASERSVFLRGICGRHLGFSKQRKPGRREKEISTKGWSIGEGKEGKYRTVRLPTKVIRVS